jgi:cysteine desulfurase/selenocysteine lyase
MDDTALATYRTEFPFLNSGKVYLNHAAISPLPSRTRAAVERYLALRSRERVDPYEGLAALTQDTKARIGRLINAPADRIAFVDNTSNGLNILASGFPWKPGDRVLLNSMEFPANVYPFLHLKRLGVEIDFIPCPDGILTAEMMERALTPRTRIVSLSFVQFLNGFKADLQAIGQLCRSRKIVFCVDAIQGLGAAPLDVQASNIDFLSCGGHKWLMALEGQGFLFITHELQETITQQYVGWTSRENFMERLFEYDLTFAPTARRYENGTLNAAGIVALHASLGLLLEVGIERIHRHLLALTDRLLAFLRDRGAEVVTPPAHHHRAGILTWRDANAKRVFLHLQERDIHVSLREGCLRVAPHLYNTADEIDMLTRALSAISD